MLAWDWLDYQLPLSRPLLSWNGSHVPRFHSVHMFSLFHALFPYKLKPKISYCHHSHMETGVSPLKNCIQLKTPRFVLTLFPPDPTPWHALAWAVPLAGSQHQIGFYSAVLNVNKIKIFSHKLRTTSRESHWVTQEVLNAAAGAARCRTRVRALVFLTGRSCRADAFDGSRN